MRYTVISVLVLIPLLALLSLLRPLIAGAAERPIGPAFAAPQVGIGDAAQGAALYRSKCYGCHAPEAKVGPAHNSPEFKARYVDDEALTVVVRAGRPPMPAFSEDMLREQELADIIAYIRAMPAP